VGRELRRVPLDFDWPLNKCWKGFINPHWEKKCPACRDNGYPGNTQEYYYLEEFVRRLLLTAESSHSRPENYVPQKGAPTFHAQMFGIDPGTHVRWPFDSDPVDALASLVQGEISEGDAAIIRRIAHLTPKPGIWSPQKARYEWGFDEEGKRTRTVVLDPEGGMYYPHPYLVEDDGIPDPGTTFADLMLSIPEVRPEMLGWQGAWSITKALFEYHGDKVGTDDDEWALPAWCVCQVCQGTGIEPEAQAAHDAWEKSDPPEGEAYQIWETVSDGSPVSPPFATPEELARWMVGNDDSITKDTGYEGWLRFINGPGFAMTAQVNVEGAMASGVAASTEDYSEHPYTAIVRVKGTIVLEGYQWESYDSEGSYLIDLTAEGVEQVINRVGRTMPITLEYEDGVIERMGGPLVEVFDVRETIAIEHTDQGYQVSRPEVQE